MNRKNYKPGELAGKLCLVVIAAIVIVCLLFGCAKDAENQRPVPPPQAVYDWCRENPENSNCAWLLLQPRDEVTFAETVQPWAIGFLIFATLGALIWYLVTFSRLAFIGDQFCQECGGRSQAMKILAKLKADNAARLAGAVSAAAFGAHKDPKS